jgi:hypothetical protein
MVQAESNTTTGPPVMPFLSVLPAKLHFNES